MMTYSTKILREVKDKWEMNLNEDLSYNIIENAFKEVTNMNTGAYQKTSNLNYSIIVPFQKVKYVNCAKGKLTQSSMPF